MRNGMCVFVCLCVGVCVAADGPGTSGGDGAGEVSAQRIATTYTTLRLMTKAPVYVDPHLAMLCINLTPEQIAAARKASGPHALARVRIFMNEAAAGAFGKPNPKYPVGSIIVKEKEALGIQAATQPGEAVKTNDGVGGMIKRAPGYDPEHGDWEYFYFDTPAKVASGKMSSCIGCHEGEAEHDYVFGGWAEGAR